MEFELQIRQPGMPEHSAEERIDKFHKLAGAQLPLIHHRNQLRSPPSLTAYIPTPEHEHSLTDSERKTMASFESLDYTIVESEIHRLRQQKAGREDKEQEQPAVDVMHGGPALVVCHLLATRPWCNHVIIMVIAPRNAWRHSGCSFPSRSVSKQICCSRATAMDAQRDRVAVSKRTVQ